MSTTSPSDIDRHRAAARLPIGPGQLNLHFPGGPIHPGAVEPGGGQAPDATGLEGTDQVPGAVVIFQGDEVRQELHQCDLGTKAGKNGGKFHPYRARADDDNGLGHQLHLQ